MEVVKAELEVTAELGGRMEEAAEPVLWLKKVEERMFGEWLWAGTSV